MTVNIAPSIISTFPCGIHSLFRNSKGDRRNCLRHITARVPNPRLYSMTTPQLSDLSSSRRFALTTPQVIALYRLASSPRIHCCTRTITGATVLPMSSLERVLSLSYRFHSSKVLRVKEHFLHYTPRKFDKAGRKS